ncbi:LysR family transcriptional regulator [Leucobacter luti]|uniref:DNA-binding transcriptional LysR family regulator n=1 Tax=Leucobacter luti TaxID=340320 RepID=A0A4Q7TWI2_9MICO|nr:LysR family transcriptional regulator [Leucobacter luti]MBL3698352.1 LysR family transcriptional regulator [Leucobacter luti]RZT64560.1 DNA-binding transcriptional LysR family regulator [Leucobacter luti]
MIDLRQLQALSAVAAEGSVARAATRLGWSQPTVDYHLRNLDRLVGADLTVRSTRGSKLTTAGTLMLERAEEILGLADRALTDVRDLAQLGRIRLRFGTFPTAAARLLPGITSRVAELGIELDATLEELSPLVTRVNQHTLDAALVYAAGGYQLPFRAEVHTTHLFTDPMLLALPATHPAAHHRSFDRATLLTLAHDSWVMGSTPGDTLDDLVREVFQSAGHKVDVAIRTDDYSVVLGLIAAGMAVALVPSLVSNQAPEGVVLRPIDDPRFARELLLAAPAGPGGPSAAVRQLAEAVRRSISALG